MNKKLGAAALATMAVPVFTLGAAALAAANEDDQQAAQSENLNVQMLPERAARYVPWITRSAKQCDGLSPGILAAQIQRESNFNPDAVGPETHSGKAIGIAQFLPSTFGTYGKNSDGDSESGPQDPEDAIMAMGRMMCSLIARAERSGYPGDPVKLALAGYNAGWGNVQRYGGIPPFKETSAYVAVITKNAERFSAGLTVSGSGDGAQAVRRAATQLGVPYAWGGGRPDGPSLGFCDGTNGYLNGECAAAQTRGWDCSSLVQYAYWPTQQLPRVASDQYTATAARTVDRNELRPGDLVFWSKGGTSGVYHVALYAGKGRVLHAPRTGRDVELRPLQTAMPGRDYYGATRP